MIFMHRDDPRENQEEFSFADILFLLFCVITLIVSFAAAFINGGGEGSYWAPEIYQSRPHNPE